MISEEEENLTEFKVFVSRIPQNWTKELLVEHFMSLFGDIAEAEIFTSRKRKSETRRGEGNICYSWKNTGTCDKNELCPYTHVDEILGTKDEIGESLGSGCVYFHTEEAMNRALDQKSLHLSKRVVKISKFADKDSRDTVTCYAVYNDVLNLLFRFKSLSNNFMIITVAALQLHSR